MELSMTIAILAALAIGQFFTALIIVLFVLIAEVLEGLTVQRGRTAIRELLNLLPNEVTVRRNGRAEQRSTESEEMMNESSGEILKASFGKISLTPREVIHRRCWRGVGVASMDGPTPVLASNQEVPRVFRNFC